MGPVTTLVIAFILLSLLIKIVRERLELYLLSNVKYRLLDALGPYIYYGKTDVGIEASLQFDSPSDEVLSRRLVGQKYLSSKLGGGDGNDEGKKGEIIMHGPTLATQLVDCRFALSKVCMPLLRELEFPTIGRNFITNVTHGSATKDSVGYKNKDDVASAGMIHVTTEDGISRPYVGNDAVHTLSVRSFHAPIQEQINRRMSLRKEDACPHYGGKEQSTTLRFCPIAMNTELERNVELVRKLTGMEKVRYSLSGSEAVDGALKDIKASCDDKPLVVRFKSAYHGHVSGVSVVDCPGHVFLPECTQSSIDFIEKYHYRIAAVIMNPMQHFTGINKPSPPGEKVTVGKRIRSAVPREEYARWLHSLQEKCTYCTKYLTRVALVMDDIYFAFRTPELLSTNYFVHPDTGVALKPDVIILGKAIAAGYPLSCIAGREGFLNTYDKKFLLKLNKTVGTLAAWHGGLVASNAFLETMLGEGNIKLEMSAIDQLSCLVRKCDAFTASINVELESKGLPIRVRNFSNTFSIDFLNDSLYNSRFPQYLLAEGMFLGNYSTGKFNLNADVTTADLQRLSTMFVSAADKMQNDGYFEPMKPAAKRKFYSSLLLRFAKNYATLYYDQIMADKHIDIEVSHNHPVNKFGHFWSSVGMIVFAYPLIFWYGESLRGCAWFFGTHVVRQSGHFFYEHQDRDIEKLKFGHKDASKKEAVAFLTCAAIMYNYRDELVTFASKYVDPTFFQLSVDQYVLVIALFTVVPHFVEIVYQYGVLRGLSWALKILTDPFTDLLDFYTHAIINPIWFLDFKEHKATYKLDIITKKVVKVE